MNNDRGCRIVPDKGTNEQKERYVFLLKEATSRYALRGLPPRLSKLFTNYRLPPDVPVQTPKFVFIEYPQRPKLEKHDFSKVQFSLPKRLCYQSGPANVLFNEDFTLVFGRLKRSNAEYGYGMVLLRNDKLRIYTSVHLVHKYGQEPTPYRTAPSYLLAGLQELVVLAFYRPQFRRILEKYRKGNDEIARYLDYGHIEHKSSREIFKAWPITCFECGESKFVTHAPQEGKAVSCFDCYIRWKAEGGVSAPIILKTNVCAFRKFIHSKGWVIVDEKESPSRHHLWITDNTNTITVTFFPTGRCNINGVRHKLGRVIVAWWKNYRELYNLDK